MALIVQLAAAADAEAVGKLAQQFAGYLRRLGDTTDFKLTADAYLRDGFGPKPAFPGLVAELDGNVIGYLLAGSSSRSRRSIHALPPNVTWSSRSR